jgi:hypothetical protein
MKVFRAFLLSLFTPLAAAANCGDLNDDLVVTATDALVVLNGAVGLDNTCDGNCDCDLDCTRSISATDAFSVLRWAVFGDVGGCCVADYCFNDEDCEVGYYCGTSPTWSCDAMCVQDPNAITFAFRLHGMPTSEQFHAVVSSPEIIALARSELQLPESERLRFAIGGIAAGDGSVNVGWSWHFTEVNLTELAIELCDGTPSMVEADLDYWLDTVKTFCPWASYVYDEVE